MQSAEAYVAYLQTLPDEFYKETIRYANAINQRVGEQQAMIEAAYQSIQHLAQISRGVYAREAIRRYAEIKAYLFARLDGRDLRPLLLRDLDVAKVVMR